MAISTVNTDGRPTNLVLSDVVGTRARTPCNCTSATGLKPSLTLSFCVIVKELSVQCHPLVPATSLPRIGSIASMNDVRNLTVVDVRGNGSGLSVESAGLKDARRRLALLIQSETLASVAVVKRLCVLLNVTEPIFFQLCLNLRPRARQAASRGGGEGENAVTAEFAASKRRLRPSRKRPMPKQPSPRSLKRPHKHCRSG